MKRFLLLFCAAVLSCALIVVPALAAETDTYTLFVGSAGSCMDGPLIPVGRYRIELVLSESDQQILISENLEIESTELCKSLPGFVHEGVSYSIQFCPDIGGISTVDIFTDDGTFSLGPCVLRFTTFVPEPSPNEGFWSDIGSFFKQSMIWLSAVANVVVQSPALLVLTIGIAVILFIVFAVQRIKNQ